MAYSNISDTQLLDPLTGQYYTEQRYTPPTGGFWGNGTGGGIFNQGYSPYDVNRNAYAMPQTRRNYTGNVSQVWKMMQNKQPYQYNVPSIASMFPSMTMPTMGNFQPMQYTGGAGQFLSGLLGNAPMTAPMATPNAAPVAPATMSSGAGRFV